MLLAKANIQFIPYQPRPQSSLMGQKLRLVDQKAWDLGC
jgi:hypothetical protein